MRSVATAVLTAAVLIASLTTGVGVASADSTRGRTPGPDDVASPGAFTDVGPNRILDTRSGTTPAPVAGRSPRVVTVLGRGDVPGSGVGAVTLNVTVTNTTTGGFLSVTPSGGSSTSNLNFVAGQTVANQVTVPVAANGTVTVYNGGAAAVDLVVDVEGWYAAGTPASAGAFGPLTPVRLLDTRPSGHLNPRSSQTLAVRGRGGVPSNAGSVLLNVTAVGPTAGGFLSVYPGSTLPGTSNLNFVAGQIVPNAVAVPLASDGTVTLYNGSAGNTDVVVDVAGWYDGSPPTLSGMFGALTPTRILDTRVGTGSPRSQVPGRSGRSFGVVGTGGVPTTGVSAVVLNVTSVGSTAAGFLAVSPNGGFATSTLNFAAGQIVPNLVVVPVANDGTVTVFNGSGAPVDVLADVTGYIRATSLSVPGTSSSRYISSLTATQTNAQIGTVMTAFGRADAQTASDNGPHLSLLEFGAQSARAGGDGRGGGTQLGVSLTGQSDPRGMRLTYPQVLVATKAYLDGYDAGRPTSATGTATVALGTSSDGFAGATYTPQAKGSDWAGLVAQLATYSADQGYGLTLVGANDIEANFDATLAQVKAWIGSYTGATGQPDLINNGAAAGCPTTAGATGLSCGPVRVETSPDNAPVYNTWSQADYYAISRGVAPSQLTVLPQIYVPAQATQWANIDLTGVRAGGAALSFAGVLTQYGVCGASCSVTPVSGWSTLRQALDAVPSLASTPLPTITDLRYS